MTNAQELIDGTNPMDPCSFNAISQTIAPSSAWNNADCDGDGVTNEQELMDGTDPLDFCSFNANSQTIPPSDAWNNGDCDGDGITNEEETEIVEIFNEFSPNGDGINDYFQIDGIENYPNNRLEIYNRWGNIVFEMKAYDNSWDGTSTVRYTIEKDNKLPIGVYFYILHLGSDGKTMSGWLYINR